jgi:membrane protein DedA with SNARE-associated domain
MTGFAAGAALAVGTLVSEDAATLAAGALVAAKTIPAATAIISVALGIWVGDLGLFGIGRLAGRVPIVARWVDRRWTPDQVQSMERRFHRGAAAAILGSRFLPGTRVLLYIAAGAFKVSALTFVTSAAVASFSWAVVVVFSVGSVGAWW